MRRDEALHILEKHKSDLRSAGVRTLLLFGSVARDEAGPTSDVDLVVQFDHPVGLFELSRLRTLLEEWLGRPVDLLTEDGLRPSDRERILREAVRAA